MMKKGSNESPLLVRNPGFQNQANLWKGHHRWKFLQGLKIFPKAENFPYLWYLTSAEKCSISENLCKLQNSGPEPKILKLFSEGKLWKRTKIWKDLKRSEKKGKRWKSNRAEKRGKRRKSVKRENSEKDLKISPSAFFSFRAPLILIFKHGSALLSSEKIKKLWKETYLFFTFQGLTLFSDLSRDFSCFW